MAAKKKPATAEQVARAERGVRAAERRLLEATKLYLFPCNNNTPRTALKDALYEAWFQRNCALWEVDKAKRAARKAGR